MTTAMIQRFLHRSPRSLFPLPSCHASRQLPVCHASRHLPVCHRHLSVVHPSQFHDIVVVGGGLVGNAATVALALEERFENKSILLLDQSPHEPTFDPQDGGGFNLRVINLTVGNQKFLDRIGAWDKIRAMRSHEYDKIFCWESNSNHTISFEASPMGYIVENNVIERALLEVAANLHNVEVRRGEEVAEIKLPVQQERAVISLQSGEMFDTDLVVGADGANSLVRRTMETPVMSWMYNQQGIVCTLRSATLDKDRVAYQRFLPSGPIALLPLDERLFSLVWSCKPVIANELMSLSEEEFVARVNNALQREANVPPIVAAMETVSEYFNLLEEPPETPVIVGVEGSRAKFPLGFSNSCRYAGARCALVGDAAHRVHPLAGQGANIGFRGVQQLVTAITDHPDSSVGDIDTLNSYESALQRQVTPMLCFIDGMNKLYSSSFGPVVAARSYGLGAVNQLSAVKNAFLEAARS